jgi:hypothetical protein
MTNAQVLNPCVGGRLTGSVSSFRIANPVIGPRDYKSRGAGDQRFHRHRPVFEAEVRMAVEKHWKYEVRATKYGRMETLEASQTSKV